MHNLLAQSNAPLPTPETSVAVQLGFNIPSLGDVLTFLIRAFFMVAGLSALLFLLLGALSWITSGGAKENVEKAQQKIQAAVVGLLVIVAVLSLMAAVEQIIFSGKICVGITCPVTIPSLIKKS